MNGSRPDGPPSSIADEPLPPGDGSLGSRIRDLRREKGWTQDDLARVIGVSRSAVAQWETDRSGQVSGNLSRIAQAFEVTVEVLLHGAAARGSAQAVTGDEWALLRLYRECTPADRTFLLRSARHLAQGSRQLAEPDRITDA